MTEEIMLTTVRTCIKSALDTVQTDEIIHTMPLADYSTRIRKAVMIHISD